ncbi:hypothetical protein CFREI_09715 [Corynebacterium freiburgense]|nr:hypothetical protein CFREI_09715 [Corynebacterium freiburgense]
MLSRPIEKGSTLLSSAHYSLLCKTNNSFWLIQVKIEVSLSFDIDIKVQVKLHLIGLRGPLGDSCLYLLIRRRSRGFDCTV